MELSQVAYSRWCCSCSDSDTNIGWVPFFFLSLQGASPHASAKNGYTPLHITAKKNQLDIAKYLLEYSAKTDAESKVMKIFFFISHI